MSRSGPDVRRRGPDVLDGPRQGGEAAGSGGAGSVSFDAVVDTDGVARASRHTVLAQLATQTSRLAVNVILARLLTPSDFGVVAAAMVVMVVVWQLTDLGTSAVIIQRDVIDDVLVSSLFYANVLLGAGLCAAMITGAGPLAALLGQPAAAPAIQVLASVGLLGALGNMHHALLRRTMQFGRLAAINIANALVTGLVGISLAVAGAGIWALVAGTVAGVAVSTVAAWAYQPWRPSATFSPRRLRAVARFSIHFFYSSALAVGFAQLDKVIISRLLGGTALGTYTVAQRTVTSPINTVSEAVSTVSFSAFARDQNNVEALRSGASRAAGVVALIVLPSMLGLAVLAEDAVAVVYGPGWEAAIPVIQVLAPLAALQAISRVTASVMLAMGRSDWLYRWALAYCLAGAAVMVASSQWGLVGVSLGLAVVVVVLTPFEMMMALGLIEMRLSTYLRPLLPHAVISAVMATAAWLAAALADHLGTGSALQLLAGVATGGAVHVALMWRARLPAMDDARRVAGRWAVRSSR
ncbi:lipopolysaccharide biosynthesis protein [Nocardioides sp. CF8]|uniref:lipopolysaccharide biosynthesis protein n=1 Tax=Nocardioides sp. CF8 TaxID=110319 RepID=UPI000A0651A2|nr:lipopolysaccharide biosynthesis protein [Nocardioides sp. CF8]